MIRRATVLFVFAAAMLAAGYWAAMSPVGAQAAQEELPLEELREFSEVYAAIKSGYVDEVSDRELFDSAIRGMLQGLDPHSEYFNEDDFREFQRGLSGVFSGIGIFVGLKSGFVHVVSPIDDTPAHRAGILMDDFITKLNGTATRGMSLSDAVNIMRGEPGTAVTLEILRAGESGPLTFELVREEIKTPSVRSAFAEVDYGYIRISQFQPNRTVEDLVKAVNRLFDENGGSLKGIILDLRNNPGGDLRSSIGAASVFLPGSMEVVSDRGRSGRLNKHKSGLGTYPANELKYGAEIKTAPMVVLVNGGSASAAEIVAGALQDHGRAVIVGTRTYGKASVQGIFHLRATSNRTAIKLTSARYFTPSGRSIQARGIAPDVVVESASVEKRTEFVQRESELAGHLDPENSEDIPELIREENEDAAASPFLPQNDYQFEQALNILKALHATASR